MTDELKRYEIANPADPSEIWVYDFSIISVRQIFRARSVFELHELHNRNPGSTTDLKLSGGLDYLLEGLSYLLRPAKRDEQGNAIIAGQYDFINDKARADTFLQSLDGSCYDLLIKIRNDFFLGTGISTKIVDRNRLESSARFKAILLMAMGMKQDTPMST